MQVLLQQNELGSDPFAMIDCMRAFCRDTKLQSPTLEASVMITGARYKDGDVTKPLNLYITRATPSEYVLVNCEGFHKRDRLGNPYGWGQHESFQFMLIPGNSGAYTEGAKPMRVWIKRFHLEKFIRGTTRQISIAGLNSVDDMTYKARK